tara:strand:+ start:1546 stop:2100 length:555 start_codon:yes stop_codon:yes gene_type:complete
MWVVPKQLMDGVIVDESQRLDLIKDNLMVWGEFVSRTKWKNRKWNEFLQIKIYDPEIAGSGLKHNSLNPILSPNGPYNDLPFFVDAIEGHYLFISGDIWENEINALDRIKSLTYWPTPIASDWENYLLNKPISQHTKLSKIARNTNLLVRCVYWDSGLYGTHFPNPRWFEQMMGLPIGWTDPYL